jgi:hypothetical protein
MSDAAPVCLAFRQADGDTRQLASAGRSASVYSPVRGGLVRRATWAVFRRTLPVTGPDDRRGGWIQTYSGGRFWPMDPRIEDVRVEDVAHHLSMKARFSGACIRMLSVAQHGVELSALVGDDLVDQYAALHHDNTETFLPDVPTPVKPYIPFFRMLESAHEHAVVVGAFGVDPAALKRIKPFDKRIVADEALSLMRPSHHQWKTRPEPLGIRISAWSSEEAEERFLARHYELSRLLGKETQGDPAQRRTH